MQTRLKTSAIALVLGTSLAGTALAHHPWVLTDPGQTKVGTSVQVLPFFGHEFPIDDPMHPERIAELVLLSGDSEQIDINRATMSTPALANGVHVVALRQVRGYWTQTTEGGQRLPKSEVANAVRCSYSDNGSKTLVAAGDGGPSAAASLLGHRLEIVLHGEPTALVAGDTLPVQVLFEGQPHIGPLLAFHSASGEDPYALLETGADGRAEVVLEGQGPWLLLAHGEIDYPDPSVCDVESFYASLSITALTHNP
ncbi:MAG: DUF4198 domain-containing protein [Wenzhouxiangella sp.]|jgi:uncharacterized GH25 family protein|nr:DUF4198 domain-containing protein [Wenzhouxiangella sp.]